MSSRQSLRFTTASGTERTLTYKATPRNESTAFKFMAYATGRPPWARGIVKSVTHTVSDGNESQPASSGSSTSRRALPSETKLFWVRAGKDSGGFISDTASSTPSGSGSSSTSSSSPDEQGSDHGGTGYDPGRVHSNDLRQGVPGHGIPNRAGPIPHGPVPDVFAGRNDQARPDARPLGRVPYNGPGPGS